MSLPHPRTPDAEIIDGMVRRVMGSRVQAKLRIGRPGDAFEQEADRMADWVVGGAPQARGGEVPRVSAAAPPSVQRLSAERSPSDDDVVIVDDEAPGQAPGIQKLERAGGGAAERAASSPVAERVEAASAGGRALAAPVRDFMEQRFNQDFGAVRIHTDAEAAGLSDALGARAFAHRNHIYFSAGEYHPGDDAGKRVLAHELTHVLQQRAAGQPAPAIQRMTALGAKIQHGVAPWGAGGPVGTDYKVATDSGTQLQGWQAYSPYALRLHYWCHGHSLGTFARFGYSVYSGWMMQAVIRDEYNNVAADQARSGDLAVWTAGWDHSAILTNPVVSGGALDPDATTLSSKNGMAAANTFTLRQLMGIYGGAGIAVYRHK